MTAATVSTGHDRTGLLPRVVGLDAARGVAILGMFAVHVGPQRGQSGSQWLDVFSGRSAALFAVLAGVSLALLSGGEQVPVGVSARQTLVRIAGRAVLIAAIGLALTELHTSVSVILVYYGIYFLLALPLLWLSLRSLATLTLTWAIGGPILSFLIRAHIHQTTFGGSPTFSMFGSFAGLRELGVMLVLTGAYPALTWMPFLLAGLTVGRLGIRSVRPRVVIGVGLVSAGVGYGGSWVAQHPFGGRQHLIDTVSAALGTVEPGLRPEDILDASAFGTVGTNSWWWLTVATPHSGTAFEVLGATGVALMVIGALLAAQRPLRIAMHPLSCAGSCSLSLYILQMIGLHILMPVSYGATAISVGVLHRPSWALLSVFVLSSLILATLWRSFFRRGPAEWLLHEITIRLAIAANKGWVRQRRNLINAPTEGEN
ncbi:MULTISPECIES: DUF418 domain-containing protein [unclassified Nocardia]|uniref:DUF418 domain-containing protein n=1 Tax=unclassified Nocardia TaxID=2637762 RepID=UPI001CE48796|nr:MULTISPECIES: DUF418 domain-containing protein [unclassified Nocardia]